MWRVKHDPHLKLLELRVRGFVASRDIDAIARAWARALAATAGDPCVALFDLRGLEPLEGAAVQRLRERIKVPALEGADVRRLVIVVDSATGALQQRYAVVDPTREFVTQDAAEAASLLVD